mmetsp:Transcript_29365/g.33345  ORF Transcript_29365/g.33345 Transcript_29365/m.33345 type:complete len:122 (+) Transcript_29365:40-405(+)
MNHNKRGLLSMANSGKDTNSSQFFFTLKPVPYLNGKHVIFGEVVMDDEESRNTLEEISKVETDTKTQRPIQSITISSCGIIDEETGKDIPSIGMHADGKWFQYRCINNNNNNNSNFSVWNW